jgi:hypothetical protein
MMMTMIIEEGMMMVSLLLLYYSPSFFSPNFPLIGQRNTMDGGRRGRRMMME